ncbi:hypothetical protein HELRODRAFT_69675 [Helobdella robusta]|uniref:Soluble calcium-activated nucleotidase 1 n=1 Tax=Helobdella robusta TaxID=6412 RepID=T1FZX9_HELRO|nr:hypothetical protein HELRODRAFT_69675 [Helobdella robusta]ESN92556.1 hypothetical protein HELRODRAFT_69675 [Helobdella robusta]
MLLVLTGIVLILVSYKGSTINDQQCTRMYYRAATNKYNSTYPLTSPVYSLNGDISFRIAIISDLDTSSKQSDGSWVSHMRKGWLTINKEHSKVDVKLDEQDLLLHSDLSLKGRAMELSDLVVFNGKLYTCDDRTGMVFEITQDNRVVPFAVLNDGNGHLSKGFKCEWMTVKDEIMWVGGLGKEWTSTKGVVENLNPQWTKSVGYLGDVQHHNWVDVYNKLRKFGGFELPGYLIHEAVSWSAVYNQWFFLPRRASREVYTEEDDEQRATNILFRSDEDFYSIEMSHLGPQHNTRGFSSFKFVPGTKDSVIIALKSEEDKGKIASYIVAYRIDGTNLMKEFKIGELKYEGIEFI